MPGSRPSKHHGLAARALHWLTTDPSLCLCLLTGTVLLPVGGFILIPLLCCLLYCWQEDCREDCRQRRRAAKEAEAEAARAAEVAELALLDETEREAMRRGGLSLIHI